MARKPKFGERLENHTIKLKPMHREFLRTFDNGSEFIREFLDHAMLDRDQLPEKLVADLLIELNRKIKQIEKNRDYLDAKKWVIALEGKSEDEIRTSLTPELRDPSYYTHSSDYFGTWWSGLRVEIYDARMREWDGRWPQEFVETVLAKVIEDVRRYRSTYRAFEEKLSDLKSKRSALDQKLANRELS